LTVIPGLEDQARANGADPLILTESRE